MGQNKPKNGLKLPDKSRATELQISVNPDFASE